MNGKDCKKINIVYCNRKGRGTCLNMDSQLFRKQLAFRREDYGRQNTFHYINIISTFESRSAFGQLLWHCDSYVTC